MWPCTWHALLTPLIPMMNQGLPLSQVHQNAVPILSPQEPLTEVLASLFPHRFYFMHSPSVALQSCRTFWLTFSWPWPSCLFARPRRRLWPEGTWATAWLSFFYLSMDVSGQNFSGRLSIGSLVVFEGWWALSSFLCEMYPPFVLPLRNLIISF